MEFRRRSLAVVRYLEVPLEIAGKRGGGLGVDEDRAAHGERLLFFP